MKLLLRYIYNQNMEGGKFIYSYTMNTPDSYKIFNMILAVISFFFFALSVISLA